MKDRFEQYVMPVPWSGCHIWMGGCFGNDIPAFSVNNRAVQAYKVAYELYCGPLNGEHVLHTCDNPLCVNPTHLFLGTPKDNAQDRMRKSRGVQRHASVTWEQAQEIRVDPRKYKEIANHYEISIHVVRDIKAGRTYKDAKTSRNTPLQNWERFGSSLVRETIGKPESTNCEVVQ